MQPLQKVKPPRAQPAKGFFTDATLCIGCKACEVACKEWNQLPAETPRWTGHSYDNTGALSATTWRHVLFVEQPRVAGLAPRWLMVSDVCKHCQAAPCLEACPTGSIIRTEFDTVYVQQEICNGCGYCIAACPFGVIERNPADGVAHKCTLCYDRLKADDPPACAKACPTHSIQFGDLADLHQRAERRLVELHARGQTEAYLYGYQAAAGTMRRGTAPLEYGLNAFFLLTDRPDVYNLPLHPRRPARHARSGYLGSLVMALGLLITGALAFRGDGGNR